MKSLILVMLLASQVAANRPGSVAGRLLTRDGTAAADARVVAVAVDGGGAEQAVMSLARTDATGRYKLEDLPPGRYFIAAGSLDALSYFPGVTARGGAAVVVIGSGAALAGIDFRLLVIPPLRVSGRLVFEGALPSGLLSLRLAPVNPVGAPLSGAGRAAAAGADGRFEFQNVLPGTYRLSLAEGGVDALIEVVDRDLTGLDVPVRTQVPVRQSVAVDDGSPLPTFDLVFTDLNFKWIGPVSRAGARFLAEPLWTGEYAVEARGLPPGFFVKTMTWGARDLRTGPLEVRGGGPQPEVTVTLGVESPGPWVALNGRLTGDGAAAVKRVSASGSALRERVLTDVAADGAFVFPKLLPGSYTIAPFPNTDPLPAGIAVSTSAGSGAIELAVRAIKRVRGRALLAENVATPLEISLDVACPAAAGSNEVSVKVSAPLEPDGRFSALLPAGGCRIGLNRASFPEQTILRPLTYSGLELTGSPPPLFTYAESEELSVVLGPVNGSIAVTGRLTRVDPAVRRLILRRQTFVLDSVGNQAAIDAEGAFAFSLPGGSYLITPATGSAIPIPDIAMSLGAANTRSEIVLALPRVRRIVGRARMEGGPLPEKVTLFVGGTVAAAAVSIAPPTGLQFSAPATEYHGYSVTIAPSRDGAFDLLLPEGQYWLLVEFPEDAVNPPLIRSVTAGGVNLKGSPLKVGDADLQFEIVFEAVPRP